MASDAPSRVQLCGPLVVRLNGVEIAGAVRGTQARSLLAYLLLNRTRQVTRGEVVDLLWGPAPPQEYEVAIRALASKLRKALERTGAASLPPGDALRLHLSPDVRPDVEVAVQALHDAQSAAAQGRDVRAWVHAHIALNISSRTFLEGDDGAWIDERRAALLELRTRALQALAECALRLGGPELSTAERASRELVRSAPFRESGHAQLIRTLATQGNIAEAVLAYDRLRTLLRDELGLTPSPELQALHGELLEGRIPQTQPLARE